MSHFSVVVCLDDTSGHLAKAIRIAREGADPSGFLKQVAEQRIETAMAPFSEALEVEPYRSYEDGGPEDHWLVSSIRRGAAKYAELQARGPEALAAELADRQPWLAERTGKLAEQFAKQEAEWAEDARWATRIPDPVTWADIVKLYAERYGDEEEKILVTEDGTRAYRMSTYNPASKWDYWRVGGRWGGYFRFRPEHRASVIMPERGWDSPEAIDPRYCDGGPKLSLDLDAMREDKAAEARKRYASWAAVTAGTPDALPWSVFTENDSEGNGYTIEQAREEYRSQPRVQALEASEDFRHWWGDAVAEFQVPEALYTERERARAVPGYATLTADGRWMAPGEMGWFGASTDSESDRIGYWEAANAYIEALPDDAWLVAVDCHI